MRDLLRYILIAVLVVVVGWFLIGELKEWTIVDNSVNIEDSGDWELLFNYSTSIEADSYLSECFDDFDIDYDVYYVNFIVDSYDSDIIYNSHFLILDESFTANESVINFITTDSFNFTYYYSLWLNIIQGELELEASVVSGTLFHEFDFSVKIWGVK